ncbi:MAG: universal stress protein [bacterium]|nr:universal stress protein [bacterium]
MSHRNPLGDREHAREALERHADLIVMGSRGLIGFKHVALGSVAVAVVRTASCLVLTVPPSAN